MTTTPATDYAHPKFFLSLKSAEEVLVKGARKNPVKFINYISDGRHSPASHHLEWLVAIFVGLYNFINIIAPRGSAKTTHMVYAICYKIGVDPLSNNAIFSANNDSAATRLKEVRDIITSQRFKNVFPHIHIDETRTNTTTEFTVWCSRWKGKDIASAKDWRRIVRKHGQPLHPTIFAKGVTASGIAGHRITGILLLDDVHDEKNSATTQQRAKIILTIQKTIFGCLWLENATPVVIAINTRWGEDDSSGVFKEQRRADGSFVWHTIDTPALDKDLNSYWPEVFTVEILQGIREQSGEVVFQLMYMNNPTGASTGEFDLDMFRNVLPEAITTEGFLDELYISCDFADTEGLRADWTVFNAIGRRKTEEKDRMFDVFVVDMLRFKRTLIKDKVKALDEFIDRVTGTYGPVKAVLMEKRDSLPEQQGLMEIRTDVKVLLVPTKGDKATRLKPFARIAQLHRLYTNHLMKDYHMMCSELIAFPGKHDDIVDTCSLPFQLEHWALSARKPAGRTKAVSVHMI